MDFGAESLGPSELKVSVRRGSTKSKSSIFTTFFGGRLHRLIAHGKSY